MAVPQEEIARLAAARLSNTLDPKLPQLVEGVLANPDLQHGGYKFDPATAISLASLIVSIAGFAWTVYQDLKKDAKAPDKSVIVRKTRIKFENTQKITREERDLLIEAVVEETVNFKESA